MRKDYRIESSFHDSLRADMILLASGPFFHWSDTWKLIINTLTNIVGMLMIFIQTRRTAKSAALQLKVDELLRSVRSAQNAFINLEELTEEDLMRIKGRYESWPNTPARSADILWSRASCRMKFLSKFGRMFEYQSEQAHLAARGMTHGL